ncbi:MAG: septal ring lytic transglycosylase RlpA family protein [Truepera sp.]|nr:septal ring lytic transglycosylase RlpA family protein [Truepera sp.]
MQRLWIILVLLLASCLPALPPAPRIQAAQGVSARALGLPAEGVASWYGPGFAGRRTANGEIFDPAQLTAAHRTLPFGTQVRVTHLANGLSVVVRINDRGPFRAGRIIDLSRAAAERLRMIGSGTATVRLELVQPGETPIWTALADARLGGFDILSRFHERGDLLFLTSATVSNPILVRVVGNDIPPEQNADLLLPPEVFALLGGRVYAAPPRQ